MAISGNIGNRETLALSYLEFGTLFYSLGKYGKANEYNKQALAIFTDIGDRDGVARVCLGQGALEGAVGNLPKAKEYLERALAISEELRNGEVEGAGYLHLGRVVLYRAEYDHAEHYIKMALGDISGLFSSLEMMGQLRIVEGKIQEAISYFHSATEKCEKIRNSLYDNDTNKISFLDRNIRCYRELSKLLFATGNPPAALYASELSRARALAELMSAQYSVKNQITSNPLTWTGLEGIAAKESNQTFLYVSYFSEWIHLWILKENRVAHYQRIQGCDVFARGGLRRRGPEMNLPMCYKLIIAPVMDYLKGPEIIIVPDRALCQIPFAALTNERRKYLSETFRIRIVPSLTTLKLIKESPADYHCQTGALIVGNPDVGKVIFKGRISNISRLPCAADEAKKIAKKLGVEPLLGQQATKKAVLQAINSVALIHIAAHGDAERGAVVLAPSLRIPNRIPTEGLCLLTMSNISKIQLRAKLALRSLAVTTAHVERQRPKELLELPEHS